MAGWLDYHEDECDCIFCGVTLKINLVEDGDPHRDPMIIIGLCGGQVQCPICDTVMYDRDLQLGDDSTV